MKQKYLLFLFLFSIPSIYAICALRHSAHTPNSVFGLNHVIIPKNTFKITELFVYENSERPTSFFVTFGSYGITDRLTFVPTIPIVSKKPVNNKGDKTGLGNISLQFNYLLYEHEELDDARYRFMITAGAGFPTTTINEVTLFSLKGYNTMIAAMQDFMSKEWFAYADFGTIIVGKNGNNKTGNFLIYDMGLGRILCINDHYITFMAEFFGVYMKPDRINGIIHPITGGNAIFVGPTLHYFFKDRFLHAGILAKIATQARSTEKQSSYLIGVTGGYYF
jgi:hypothetical protein